VITDEGGSCSRSRSTPDPQGLRTAYPLAEVRETEVLRAAVRYAMPRKWGHS